MLSFLSRNKFYEENNTKEIKKYNFYQVPLYKWSLREKITRERYSIIDQCEKEDRIIHDNFFLTKFIEIILDIVVDDDR